MSDGYAARLKEYPNKGVCGLPEKYETKRQYSIKIEKLAKMIADSKHFVVLTGAGISTASGVPDFRGPKGIWTLEKEASKKRKRQVETTAPSINFEHATPTLTHQALTKLVQEGKLKYVITQNVDGLHKKSGLSRDVHSVLHGCVFTEKCERCEAEYFRDFDIGGMSFQPTGRKCDCGGVLRNTLLDWEDPLPDEDFDLSTKHCEEADLVVTLGTSLRIEPAASLPTYAKKFVIVNLQETPKDTEAALIIRERTDKVMKDVMERLGYHPSSYSSQKMPSIERQWTPTILEADI